MKSGNHFGYSIALLLATLAFITAANAQKDEDNEPTSMLNFVIVKDDNGKPVRNAAVIMHAVNREGKQERGDLELKTDLDGKANFDGVPYGRLRVQVLASGFQTYGGDYDVNQAQMNFTIKLKRPQNQYSIYGSPNDGKPDNKTPPPNQTKPQ